MNINAIKESFINVSGNIYNSEFINLANVEHNEVHLDDRTLFLDDAEKNILNKDKIENYDNAIYVYRYKDTYGIICDLPIEEYNSGNVRCHELVLSDTIQGMLSNLHGYNCEVAPVLLAHQKSIDYKKIIESGKYTKRFEFENLDMYVFCGDAANEIIKEFSDVKSLYVADGHHRLYTTSLCSFKNSVLSCIVSFDYLKILPIHRIIPDIKENEFNKAKEFICRRFEVLPGDTPLCKGRIRITYKSESFVVSLIELNSDAFWNNDVYRLNTQIISQAFRIFNTDKLVFASDAELKSESCSVAHNDVLIETFPIDKDEFVESIDKKCIMPPKSTWFAPKFPSFLIFKKYQ